MRVLFSKEALAASIAECGTIVGLRGRVSGDAKAHGARAVEGPRRSQLGGVGKYHGLHSVAARTEGHGSSLLGPCSMYGLIKTAINEDKRIREGLDSMDCRNRET